MSRRMSLQGVLLVLVSFIAAGADAAPASTEVGQELLIRASPDEIEKLTARHGLRIEREIWSGSEGESLYRVVPLGHQRLSELRAELVRRDPAVRSIQMGTIASVPEASIDGCCMPTYHDSIEDAIEDGESDLFGKKASSFWWPRSIWRGFVRQPSANLVDASDSLFLHFRGGATVAIIDTGIDPDHELFTGRLVEGFDFVSGQPGDASEWSGLGTTPERAVLDQSTMAILGDEELFRINQSTMAILGDEQADELDDMDDLAFGGGFGHGTMVAGVIHRVAPEAYLMPLRAFDRTGFGNLTDVIEAIYWAVDHGADVINMSFTFSGQSHELQAAIEYAANSGVVMVSAVGNEGTQSHTYPAAFPQVIGVAATTYDDDLSGFSNYGEPLVTLAAPGESVITAFPGGGWAVGSGTSFAAPWVAGTIARLVERVGWHSYPSEVDFVDYLTALSSALPVDGGSGFGRVDLGEALSVWRVLDDSM